MALGPMIVDLTGLTLTDEADIVCAFVVAENKG